ncbi:MAG: GNAT family acetyltransferase [Halioglobus sp.]|nr:GNAT family acetyltransferase [Halioglobus sp.]
MLIRRYQHIDRRPLIDLWTQVFNDQQPHNSPARMIDAKLAADDLIFLALLDKQVVGGCMAGYDGHRGWLYAVAVLPQQRRNGAGAALVKETIAALKSLGCIKINLQIRSHNRQVADFYQALGFNIEDRLSMGTLIT